MGAHGGYSAPFAPWPGLACHLVDQLHDAPPFRSSTMCPPSVSPPRPARSASAAHAGSSSPGTNITSLPWSERTAQMRPVEGKPTFGESATAGFSWKYYSPNGGLAGPGKARGHVRRGARIASSAQIERLRVGGRRRVDGRGDTAPPEPGDGHHDHCERGKAGSRARPFHGPATHVRHELLDRDRRVTLEVR